MFWAVTAAAALLAGLWMALPVLRGRTVDVGDAEGAISIYRDQIDEVERDRAAGLIGDAECDAACAEIERRALHAARTLDRGLSISHRAPMSGAVIAVIAAVATILLYLPIGAPGMPDQPLAARRDAELTRMAEAGDIGSRIQILIQATREDPDSFEDWWMLARSYAALGDHASSADAYRNAARLADDRPAVLSAYAEAMTLANGNKVPGAARLIFEQVARDAADPRARYYVALAKAQAQDFQGAINDWTALARASGPAAPWMGLVRRDIVNMARFLNHDVVSYLPDASPAEIAAAGGGGLLPDAAAARIASLEQELDKDPMDYKRWIALAEERLRGDDSEGAADALANARRHFAAAPFVLGKISDAEQALGLDLVADAMRGPTAEDIAAAADMTQSERDDMIAGMVAGLAARLDESPDDPEGWIMLIRSYATLGEHEKARAAFEKSTGIFAGRSDALQAIRSQTAGLVSLQ